jgi:biotin carboxylase
MQKPSVLVLAAEPGISLRVLHCLQASGCEIHILAEGPARYLRWATGYASFRTFEIDGWTDMATQAAELDAAAAAWRADILVPADPTATRLVINMREHLRTVCFPLPPRPLFHRLNNKFAFSELAHDLGLPCPRTVFLGSREEISLGLLEREIGYPMVIKPSDQSNAQGVVVAYSPDDVIRDVVDNTAYAYAGLIAQEYIPGSDIDLSLLAKDGEVLASTTQRRDASGIHFVDCPALREMGAALARATGLTGVAHIDARLDSRDGSVQMVECNPRFWSSINASLYCGLNFVAAGIAIARGISLRPAADVRGSYLPPGAWVRALAARPWDPALRTEPTRAGWRDWLRNWPAYLAETATAPSRPRRPVTAVTSDRVRFGKGS